MKCAECGKELTSNRELVNHLRHDHGTSPPIYFAKHPTAEKFCSKCKQALPITQFFEDESNNYGFRAQCINCMRPSGSKRECPICSRIFQWSAVVTHMKNDHGIPPEQAYNQYLHEKYCPKCKKVKPLNQFAKLQNPEQVYFSWCNECNLERNLTRIFSDQNYDIVQLLVTRLAFSDCCFICGMNQQESLRELGEPLHIDHVAPFSKGGSLNTNNALLLCKTCNLKKGNKEIDEYLRVVYKDEVQVQEKLSNLTEKQNWALDELKRLGIRISYSNRVQQ